MMNVLSRLARAGLFKLDAETAHALSIKGLKAGQSSGLIPATANDKYPKLAVDLAGLKFPNPLGMAAGFDKNGEVSDALISLGFGFTETGTVTPRPQSGNARPRVFRLVKDNAVINRLGFNNHGHDAVLGNLKSQKRAGITGVNIGANKDSDDFVRDYELGLEKFWNIADYFTANISSPNTPGLRDLQAKHALEKLLDRITNTRDKLASDSKKHIPVFLKIAPDLDETALDDISQCLLASSIDGLVVSNTTITRPNLHSSSNEAGGLSGRPLFERSTIVLAKMRQRMGNEFAIIGVGGIDSVESAWEKLAAGADLLQLYTGMVYHGPGLAKAICKGLADRITTSHHRDIRSLSCSKTDQWAARPIPQGNGS